MSNYLPYLIELGKITHVFNCSLIIVKKKIDNKCCLLSSNKMMGYINHILDVANTILKLEAQVSLYRSPDINKSS